MKRYLIGLALLAALAVLAYFGVPASTVLTADDMIAQALCSEARAAERSIDFDAARVEYCSEREQWRPFIEAASDLRTAERYRRVVAQPPAAERP